MSDESSPRIIDLEPTMAAAVRIETTPDQIGPEMGPGHYDIGEVLGTQGLRPVGPPFARFHVMEPDRVVFDLGIAIDGFVEPAGRVVPLELPDGRAAVLTHAGDYGSIGETYTRLGAWIDEQGLVKAGVPWEVYLTDPETTPDLADWRTDVVWPIE